ncbi:tetratricopeptide repeat protein [Streptomyces sp. NPDC047130]|uniref:tetratricopeptide repeat protein n=1 Tax=Streptomyces sp. NPDC047130 TaxID=3155261 RepID=UPI00340B757F
MDRTTADTRGSEPDGDERVTAVWARPGAHPPAEEGAERFRALIGALADELPGGHPYGLFERACAWDSTGRSGLAVPLYRWASDGGPDGHKGRRARVQPAGSPRNLGRAEEGIPLLAPEVTSETEELDDAVRCVLAPCPSPLGRDRAGLPPVLEAVAAHLPRHRRSMAGYARALRDR